MADGTSGVEGLKLRFTVEEAKVILKTERVGTERFALANTVVSTGSSLKTLEEALRDMAAELDKKDEELKETKAALRRAHDQFDDQSELVEALRAELGRS